MGLGELRELPDKVIQIFINFGLVFFCDTHFSHLARAARLAISDRFSCESFSARAFAPALPLLVRPDFGRNVSLISPVAILATITAAPITSAGRLSPRGPVGIWFRSSKLWHPNILLVTGP
jgi:hypothetical protein